MTAAAKRGASLPAPVGIPTLDELARDPGRAMFLPRQVLGELLARSVSVKGAIEAALARASAMSALEQRGDTEQFLTADQVAAEVGLSVSWVEKHLANLPPRYNVCGNPRWKRSEVETWKRSRNEW